MLGQFPRRFTAFWVGIRSGWAAKRPCEAEKRVGRKWAKIPKITWLGSTSMTVRGGASGDGRTHLLPIWNSTDRGELIVLHDQLHYAATAQRRWRVRTLKESFRPPPVESTANPLRLHWI